MAAAATGGPAAKRECAARRLRAEPEATLGDAAGSPEASGADRPDRRAGPAPGQDRSRRRRSLPATLSQTLVEGAMLTARQTRATLVELTGYLGQLPRLSGWLEHARELAADARMGVAAAQGAFDRSGRAVPRRASAAAHAARHGALARRAAVGCDHGQGAARPPPGAARHRAGRRLPGGRLPGALHPGAGAADRLSRPRPRQCLRAEPGHPDRGAAASGALGAGAAPDAHRRRCGASRLWLGQAVHGDGRAGLFPDRDRPAPGPARVGLPLPAAPPGTRAGGDRRLLHPPGTDAPSPASSATATPRCCPRACWCSSCGTPWPLSGTSPPSST